MDPLRDRQLDEWLDLVVHLIDIGWADGMPHAVLMEHLARTFDCPVAWTAVHGDGSSEVETVGLPRLRDAETWEWWRREGPAHHPLVQWFAVTRDPTAQTLGRVPAVLVPAPKRRLLLERVRDLGVDQQLSLPVRMEPGGHWAFVLGRSGPDYGDAELELARRIQLLLTLLARRAALGVGCREVVVPGLTPRETAVLLLLAEGLTARAIAHRLGSSPRTVHKHLEHLYRKLGVSDRLGAFRAAQEAGLLQALHDGFQRDDESRRDRPE